MYCIVLVRHIATPSIKFAGAYLCTWVEIGIQDLKKALSGRRDGYIILRPASDFSFSIAGRASAQAVICQLMVRRATRI